MTWTPARLGLALALGTFIAGAIAALPGLPGGDAGELISASRSLSTAHPPGYPLYVWLGWAASHLLWGSLAHRYNLFSALCAAAAAGLLGAALLRWTRNAAVAAAVAIAAACTPLMLTWSARAEVFTLNQAMAALVLLLAVSCADAPSRSNALLLGAAAGAGLGNHLTLLLLAAPLVLAATRGHRAHAALGAAAGLLVYALVPLGAVLGPAQAWGDVLTPGGFVAHVLRSDYGTLQLASSSVGAATPLLPQLAALARSQLDAAAWVGVPLAALGAWTALRAAGPRRALAIALLVGWLLASVVFVALARFPMSSPLMASVLARFFLLPELPLFFLAGVALARRPAKVLLALIVAGSLLRWGLQLRQRPPDALHELYAAALLEPLPPSAVLLVRGDLVSNSVRYAQTTGARPDVAVLDQELLTYPWYVARRPPGVAFPAARWNPSVSGGFSLAELVAANGGRPFFIAGDLKPGDPTASSFSRWPAGLSERLAPAGADSAPALAGAVAAEHTLLESPFAKAAALPRHDVWELAAVDELWEAQHRLAVLQIAATEPERIADGERRIWELIERRGTPPPQYFRNAAIASAKLGHLERERLAIERYLAAAPADAPDRAAFEAELTRLPR